MVEYQGKIEDPSDVILCVETILTTPHGTMPYMRSMGIDSAISSGTPNSCDDYADQAVNQVEMWEDRVNIKEVTSEIVDGKMIKKVVVEDGE